ncbi:MAG: hypothetical protein IJV52_04865, partial [Prevotella sp.]|nr:hypothetical protein [Prevotella sp.]
MKGECELISVKKTLRQRVTAFVTAMATSLTLMLPGIAPAVSAAGYGYHDVFITVYDKDGVTETALTADGYYNYYALAMVVPEGTTKLEHDTDGKSWKNVLAYGLQKFEPQNMGWKRYDANGQYSTTDNNSSTDYLRFGDYNATVFYPWMEKLTATPFVEVDDPEQTFAYDSDQHDVLVRVYQSSSELSDYWDCVNNGYDSIDGYRFGTVEKDVDYTYQWGWQTFKTTYDKSNTTQVSITHNTATYSVNLQTLGNVTITEDDKIWLRVTVDHQSGKKHYFIKQLTMDDIQAGKIDIQTADSSQWLDGNGNATTERMSGNETFTCELVKYLGEGNGSVSAIRQGEHLKVISEGGVVGLAKVSYNDGTVKNDDNQGHVTVYNTITLSGVSVSEDESFMSILGDGLHVGITADRFEQNNHAETNLAVNYYEGNNEIIEPDLSGAFGGHFYIANYVNYPTYDHQSMNSSNYTDVDLTQYVMDEDCVLYVGQACGKSKTTGENQGMIFHTDKGIERLKDPRDFVDPIFETPGNITNNSVEPIISQMEAKSAELLTHSANITPVYNATAQKLVIDTSNYPENATIYIDADDYRDYFAESGEVNIIKKPGQVYVFNFDDTETVKLNQYITTIVDNDGNVVVREKNSQAGTNNGDDTHQWLDHYLTRTMVWNLNSVKYIDLCMTAGIYLIPEETSVTKISATSTGWLISDGYVTNVGAEWHFVYSGLGKETYDVTLSKTDVTGENEIEGATIVIRDAEGYAVQKYVTDGKKHTIRLIPGTYTFEETGDEFEYNGVTYSVTNSTLTFTVGDDGSITVDRTQTSLKSAADAASEKAYFLFDGNKTMTLCDAVAGDETATVDVEISKADVLGDELAGAHLTLTGVDEDGNKVKFNGQDQLTLGKGAIFDRNSMDYKLMWTSGDAKTVVKGLVDGTYTLHEDAAPAGYAVATDVTFTIKDGVVESSSSVTASTDTSLAVVTMVDDISAVDISKVDAADGKELKDAILKLTGEKDGQSISFEEEMLVLGEGATAITTSGTELIWNSGTKPTTIKYIPDGTYTLTEVAAPADYGEAEAITFVIENGVVTKINDETVENISTIVMEDEKLIPTNVTISKKAMTGDDELPGASLKITKKNDSSFEAITWTSTREAKTVELQDGT